MRPMEPVRWPKAFDDPLWQYEIKWDGLRCIAKAVAGGVRLQGRSGADWTAQFPELAAALQGSGRVFDGELVVLEDGRPSFPAVMRSLRSGRGLVHYMVFDCLAANGRDLRPLPLDERRQELGGLRQGPYVHKVDAVPGAGVALYRTACESGLEGVVAKRRDSPYIGGKSGLWRKIKCWRRIRCVVLGVESAKGEIRKVRLGLAQGGEVLGVGSVGNLGRAAAEELRLRLRQGPVLADVAYLDWTEGGQLRHPRWLGIAGGDSSGGGP